MISEAQLAGGSFLQQANTRGKVRFFFTLGFPSLLHLSHLSICGVIPGSPSPMVLILSDTEGALRISHESQKGHASCLRQSEEIPAIANKYFNFEEHSQEILGCPWKEQTPDKRQEFRCVFFPAIRNGGHYPFEYE